MEKLQIYYQPTQPNSNTIKSLTISYSEFDEKNNTFKQKIVLEKCGEKYKIKRWPQLDAIKVFIETLNLEKYKVSDVKTDNEYYFIKYGDQTLITSNREDIKELLEWVGFDEIVAYDLIEYEKCD